MNNLDRRESQMESNTSSSSLNKTSSTDSSCSTRQRCSNFLRFRSLSSLVFTFAIVILQTYLITNRLRLLQDLRDVSLSSSNSDNQKLTNSIVINAILISFALIFTLLYLVINPLRIGIYSHDNFKVGRNFEKALTKSKSSTIGRFACFRLRNSKFWIETVPLGACFHLLSSLFLLIAECQINSKRIQISQKPIGDIFSTKLDFLLGEPIYRLQNSFHLDNENKNIINEIIQAKDDFSVFNTGSVNEANAYLRHAFASNSIHLDFLNYLIALNVFAVKIAQTFWCTSRKFSTLTYIYALNSVFLMAVSYCSFEILFKANNLQKIAKQLLYMRATNSQNKIDKQIESTINMIEDYGHDLVSTILYLLSSFILFLNCYLVAKFGFKCYSKVSAKFEASLHKYLFNKESNTITFKQNCASLVLLNECEEQSSKLTTLTTPSAATSVRSPSNSDSLKEENCELENSSVISEIEDSLTSSGSRQSQGTPGMLKGKKIIKKLKTNCKDTRVECKNQPNYSLCCAEHVFSFGLFVIYCLLRSLFIYEIYIVFKYSKDILFVISIFFEVVTIFIWMFTLLMLTFKKDWSFKLRTEFKLLYWNWLYQNFGNHHSSTINVKQSEIKSANDLNQEIKTTSAPQIRIDSNTGQKSNETVSKENETCLLVRDDSVFNRSANLSSSSITEVSSLMPSHGNKLLDASFNSNQICAKKQCVNVLNVANLNETLMQLDDEDSNYKRLTLNNRSNRSSKIIYENNFGNQIEGPPFFFNEQEILARNPNINRQSIRSNVIKVQTIGEIMEPPPNRAGIIHQSTNVINDSSASSFASTGDSGRDSIESPINNNNNNSNNKPTLTNSISQNSGLSTSAKPFMLGFHGVSSSSNVLLEKNQTNPNAFFLNQNNSQTVLKLAQSSHLLDTRC